MSAAPPLLDVQGLDVRFGALKAVTAMRLTVRPGEIVGLIGPNGAGKSTLVNAVSGLVRASAGRVELNGRDLTRMRSYQRFRAGLGRTFQQSTLAEELTVRQSLKVAETRGRYLRGSRSLGEETYGLCDQLGLTPSLDVRVSGLPFMERRLLSIISALCGGTRVAMLDEATAGLSRAERGTIGTMLRTLIRDHPERALIVIEHDLEFVRAVTTRSVAMVLGEHVAEGPTDEVLRDPTLVTAYIGEG